MTREWYNEVAARPDGYAQTWTCWVEGSDAQKVFDENLLAASHGCDVLDCGCGDAAFTVRLAKVARRIVGVDYAEAMIANARRTAANAGISNIAFVCCHAREYNPSPPQSFDLAFTRRGPMILGHVPELVRTGGTLMGIHPLDQSAADFAAFLSRQPGMPDIRGAEHRELLMEKALRAQAGSGYALPFHYIVWEARKP